MPGCVHLNTATLGRIVANSLLETTAFCPNSHQRIFHFSCSKELRIILTHVTLTRSCLWHPKPSQRYKHEFLISFSRWRWGENITDISVGQMRFRQMRSVKYHSISKSKTGELLLKWDTWYKKKIDTQICDGSKKINTYFIVP